MIIDTAKRWLHSLNPTVQHIRYQFTGCRKTLLSSRQMLSYLPNRFFNGSKGECKRADFIIITDSDSKKIILCIEMKSGKGGAQEDVIRQLTGAQCFIAYCREIGKAFWNQKNFLTGYVYRFVSIRDISISKKPTRLSHATGDTHDSPEKMLKIFSPKYLQFKLLAGGK